MKAKYEEKFIVINTKVFDKLKELWDGEDEHPETAFFLSALNELRLTYLEETEIDLNDKKYYVVNQDEPYAEEVLKLILEGEDKKNEV